ncbi:hypothetical protein M413DRAFT_22091 [Hebeloma cylindrosporum]|uniref:Uncharacterized protein n=1 Tax=Hebeloma cylindrosporum TaxID=76867 RepID=A0A0C3CF96_HEBCY|nr:hypothetical protein M413DRAFT_22091 [Hebeloma cylindrosporum h7]
MHEPCLSPRTGAATADVDQHRVAPFVQIREIRKELESKGNFVQGHDPFSRHLPPELLSHIFDVYTEHFNSPTNIFCGGPLRLCAVSKLWRAVAFATPRLWNTMVIYFCFPSNDITLESELTKQWLDRSGQLPLYLTFRTRPTDTDTDPSLLEPLFSLIRNFAPRWRKLVLYMPSMLYATFIGDLSCAPSLHTLKLDDRDGDLFRIQTPSLEYLEISGHFLSDIAIYWGTLTHFQSYSLSIDEVSELLRLAGRLTSCRLRGINDDLGLYHIPTTPLTHSNLKQLYLVPTDVSVEVMEGFFDLLVFPSLENFGYECTCSCSFPVTTFTSLFNRSQCHLTHFSGEFKDITPDDLISLFSALPTLTHLKLVEDWFDREKGIMTDNVLRQLTPIEGARVGLLPCLQSLEFRGKQRFSWNVLADFIVARMAQDKNGSSSRITGKMDVGRNPPAFCRNGSAIRFVSLILSGREKSMDPDTQGLLSRAGDAGVSIKIRDETFRNPFKRVRYSIPIHKSFMH